MAQPELKPALSPQEARDLSGKYVGRFLVCAQLGAGGMGEVYRATDTKLKRSVALKRIAPSLRSDQHYRKRFLREAECASRLNEPHIAGIYDVLEDNDETFLVMEYVEGQTLRKRMAQPLSLQEFLGIAEQCVTALVAAHERGIVHGDIKPENIMLTETGQVKILDFGLAKVLRRHDDVTTEDQGSSRSGALCGTLAYMSPEVLLEKEPDGRTDIFSMGIVFYEAVTGKHPFRSSNFLVTSQRILKEAPERLSQSNPKVSPELERIVGKMLAKNPAERYATAADLLVDLRALQQPSGQLSASSEAAGAWQRWKRPFAAVGIPIVLLALAVSLVPQARQRVSNWLGWHSLPRQKIVVVLPFTIVGGDTQATAFSDGLTETLTAKLTQLTLDPTLQVVSTSEVRARKVKSADEARQEFGATLVLAGSLQRSGDQLRLNLPAIDTHTHVQVGARSLTVTAADTFAVQDQIVNAAVAMLELDVPPRERDALTTHGTQVAGAYDLYLQGRGYLQNYDKVENVENAVKVFDNAIGLDPAYALAYAGRAEAYWKMFESSKDASWIERSRQDCAQALRLNSGLPAGHVCLGRIYKGTGHYEDAVAEFKIAADAEPTNDDAYRELADAYNRLGNPAEAEATYRRAIALRPHYWASYNWLGDFYYRRAQYADAAKMFERVTSLAPDNVRGLYNLGAAYVGLGRYADAISVLERSIAMRPAGAALSNLGNAYFGLRRYDEATRAFEQAAKFPPATALRFRNLGDSYYWTPGKRALAADAYRRAISLAEESLRVNPKDASALGSLAICHAMLGEKKEALDSLQKGLVIAPDDPQMLFKAALIHDQFGDVPQTLTWLQKALSAGIPAKTFRDTPNFDHLEKNPRFRQLLNGN